MKQMNNNKKTRTTILVFVVLLFFFSPRTEALLVDYHDEWDSVGKGTQTDGIAWVNTYLWLGVKDNTYDAYAFCINNDRDINGVYDICFVKNTTWNNEATLNGLTFPVSPWIVGATATDWNEAQQLFTLYDLYYDNFNGPDFFGETNPMMSSIFRAKRGQIQYYGIANPSINSLDFSDSTNKKLTSSSLNNYYSLTPNYDIIRKYVVELEYEQCGDINVCPTIGDIDYFTIDLVDTLGNVYDTYTYDYCSPGDFCSGTNTITRDVTFKYNSSRTYRLNISSSSIIGDTNLNFYRTLDIYLYGDDGLRSLGTTANDDTNNYFYVDEMLLTCNVDGGDAVSLSGQFATNTWIDINSSLSCASLSGNGYVCDSDHDETTSNSPNSLPSYPCKLDYGEVCVDFNDCWDNLACGGARTTYDGVCTGETINLSTNTYSKSCGGEGALSGFTSSNKDCVTDGGFPIGYVCDSTLDGTEYALQGLVYNNVCKAGFGVSCTIDSDCKSGLSCQAGFCGYFSYSTFTKNITGNAVTKNDIVKFDAQLSIGNNIQYACWSYNGVNDKCYGNSVNCTASCNGATFSGTNWQTQYTKQFSTGGNFVVNVKTGETGLYSSNYSESFCVSGDGTFCFTCRDNVKNDDETDIDWGGRCGTPYFYKCNNNQLDNVTFETSIDYGGFCGNCTTNATSSTDDDWFILKESNFITYPFNSTILCPKSEEIQGGVISFVLIVTGLLFLPLMMIAIVLVFFILYYLIVGGIFLYRAYKTYKSVENRLK